MSTPALAIDDGTVKGTLKINGQPVELKHAYAHFHDNAEGLLDHPKEVRVLVTDRPVPQASLQGLVFLPIRDLAKDGKVKGLLFELDPKNPNTVAVTLLQQPS